MAVEHHRDRAHQKPAGGRDLHGSGFEVDEPRLRQSLHGPELASEVLPHADAVSTLDRLEIQSTLAHQAMMTSRRNSSSRVKA
jgi:hypothetical protein